MLILIPAGLYAQEVTAVIKKADQFQLEGNLEQARYYLSIAHSLDTSNQYKINEKIFHIDSTLLFKSEFKVEIGKMKNGDSCFFAGAFESALGWYGSASGMAFHYVDYRSSQILSKNPKLKSKWMILLTKRMNKIIPADSTLVDTSEDSLVNPIIYQWRSADSVSYLNKLNSLVADKDWPLALHHVHKHVLKYGFRSQFQADVNRLHSLRMKQLKSQERSFRLKAEQIGNLESADNVDIAKIRVILAKINPEEIEDDKLRKRFIKLKKKYKSS